MFAKYTDIEQRIDSGGTFLHFKEGKDWKVRVIRIEKRSSPKEWSGVLVGDQKTVDGTLLESGEPVWGYVSELRIPQ